MHPPEYHAWILRILAQDEPVRIVQPALRAPLPVPEGIPHYHVSHTTLNPEDSE